MSYSIKIVNNETGETLLDEKKSSVIIGVVANKEGDGRSISHVDSNLLEIAQCICNLEALTERLKNKNKMVKDAVAIMKVMLSDLTDSEE